MSAIIFRKTTKERHAGEKKKKTKEKSSKCFSYSFHRVHHKMQNDFFLKRLQRSTMKHASTAPATGNNSRRTRLCQSEVLQIIKLIDCLKDLTASTKPKSSEIILDHRTCQVVLFSHQIYDLLRVGLCTCTEPVFWRPS